MLVQAGPHRGQAEPPASGGSGKPGGLTGAGHAAWWARQDSNLQQKSY
jgi:hypothetical protein